MTGCGFSVSLCGSVIRRRLNGKVRWDGFERVKRDRYLGEPKVDEHSSAFLYVVEEVAGFDIAVYDPMAMNILEGRKE